MPFIALFRIKVAVIGWEVWGNCFQGPRQEGARQGHSAAAAASCMPEKSELATPHVMCGR